MKSALLFVFVGYFYVLSHILKLHMVVKLV